MKLLLVPDSFKGTMSAIEVARLLKTAALKVFPDVQTMALPIADGGEGTVQALVEALGGEYVNTTVTGPLGEPVNAVYGLTDGRTTAVIEAAQTAGLPLVPAEKRDPRYTTSFGVGEQMRAAVEHGASRLLVGIGGSATNDGGMGMLAALGARFADEHGNALPPVGASLVHVRSADFSLMNALPSGLPIDVICDVTNPLLGSSGASFIYGPQKGATPEICSELEAGMENWARVISAAVGHNIADFAGAGAAGGLGAALGGVLGARLRPGVDAVLDAAGFDAMLEDADLVVSGEGRIDGQSVRYGKAVAGIARRCSARGVPLLAIVGGMGEGAQELYDIAECSIQPTVNDTMPLETALQNARPLLSDAAERAFRMIRIGIGIR